MAIYRMATDVVLKSDLRQYLKLPAIEVPVTVAD